MAEMNDYQKGVKDGMSRAADFVDECGHGPIATAIRSMRDGHDPCEDCGYPLPSHDPTCVSRSLPSPGRQMKCLG